LAFEDDCLSEADKGYINEKLKQYLTCIEKATTDMENKE